MAKFHNHNANLSGDKKVDKAQNGHKESAVVCEQKVKQYQYLQNLKMYSLNFSR